MPGSRFGARSCPWGGADHHPTEVQISARRGTRATACCVVGDPGLRDTTMATVDVATATRPRRRALLGVTDLPLSLGAPPTRHQCVGHPPVPSLRETVEYSSCDAALRK